MKGDRETHSSPFPEPSLPPQLTVSSNFGGLLLRKLTVFFHGQTSLEGQEVIIVRDPSGSGNPEPQRWRQNEVWPFLETTSPPAVAALSHLALMALWDLESFLPWGSATSQNNLGQAT